MAINRANMGQQIRLAPASRSAIKSNALKKARGNLSLGKPNFKSRALRMGGYSEGGKVGPSGSPKGRPVRAGLAAAIRPR